VLQIQSDTTSLVFSNTSVECDQLEYYGSQCRIIAATSTSSAAVEATVISLVPLVQLVNDATIYLGRSWTVSPNNALDDASISICPTCDIQIDNSRVKVK
jgi:hypothetical protein